MRNVICLVAFAFLFLSADAQTTYIRRGFSDLRHIDFSKNGPVELAGEWELYMSHLIAPEAFFHQVDEPGDYVAFPATWNEVSKSLNPGKGYATYHATILVKPQKLAFELPHSYSSYTFWINNQVVSTNGIVGKSFQTSKAQWLPKTVVYEANQDTLQLVIHVSNFHHAKGGIRENILVGIPQDLLLKRSVAVNSNLFLFGGLILIGLLFILVFLFAKHENSSLYFSALCVTWATRSIFSNLYIATHFFPEFPWEIAVKIEYITLYLTMIWAILFLASLFPNDVNNVFKYFFVACNGIFILLTVIFSASLYTQFLPVYLSFSLILLLYIIYVLIHAVVYEREGVWLIVSCIMLGVIIFAYDLSAYQGLSSFNPIIVNIGYLGMFVLMATCLAYQFGFLKRTVNREMLTYDDLYGTGKK